MCEFCKKVEISKYGIVMDLEIASGIYKNHGQPRYAVCTDTNSIYALSLTRKEAFKIVTENINRHLILHIVDLELWGKQKLQGD